MADITYTVRRLVARHQGALPAILTCPHGGDAQPPGVQKKRTGKTIPEDCDFQLNTDRLTRTVTREVAQTLFDVFGETPYVVIADFDRDFIDANRRLECAFEDNDAEPFYLEYHNAIRSFADEIRFDTGGLGLLFDIHGTEQVTSDQADVFFGTLNGASISALLRRDPLAMSRDRSLPGLLRTAGYVVSSKTPETIKGGFTLEEYGSQNPDGLDSIQIEIETSLRTDEAKRTPFVEDFAFAISSLIARYADTHTMAAYRTANFIPRLRRG
jgi:N-formylglutamate amidohydrolase